MLIKTNKVIRVPSGVRLRLTQKQLAARLHDVMNDVDGVVLVTHPMEFKAGEELEVVGDLPTVISADQYSVLEEPEADQGAGDDFPTVISADQYSVLEELEAVGVDNEIIQQEPKENKKNRTVAKH